MVRPPLQVIDKTGNDSSNDEEHYKQHRVEQEQQCDTDYAQPSRAVEHQRYGGSA
jgi:hypothetical protein